MKEDSDTQHIVGAGAGNRPFFMPKNTPKPGQGFFALFSIG